MPQAERQISFRAILTGNRADPSTRIASSGVGIHHCMDRRGLQPSSDPTPTCGLLGTEQPLRSNLNRKDKLSRNSGTPLIRIRFRVCRKCAMAVLGVGGGWGGASAGRGGAGHGVSWNPGKRVWRLGVGGARRVLAPEGAGVGAGSGGGRGCGERGAGLGASEDRWGRSLGWAGPRPLLCPAPGAFLDRPHLMWCSGFGFI